MPHLRRAWASARRGRGHAVCAAALLVLAGLIVATVAVVRDAVSAAHEVEGAEEGLRGVLRDGDLLNVSRGQVWEAGRKLDDAAGRLRRDERLLTPWYPLLWLVGRTPGPGRSLGELHDLVRLAIAVSAGGAHLARGVDPLLAQTDQDPGAPPAGPSSDAAPGERFVRALDAGDTALREGHADLLRAQAIRDRLHPEAFSGPLRSLRDRIVRLDAVLASVTGEADALALLPEAARDLLGFNGRRTYVILGQDSAELRPTGGFIGSAGLVSFDQGRVVFQEYRSSYDFDSPNVPPLVPPEPLRVYLGGADWLLRDANWSPDFPTAARQVEEFVTRAMGVQPDGVIAFDSFAVTELLRAIGPLTVAGFPQPVTADDWFGQATQALLIGPDALRNLTTNYSAAKGLGLSAVLRAVLDRVEQARGHDQLAMVDALRRASLSGHLQAFVAPVAPATWLHLTHADGALRAEASGDLVAPVEANLGYSKVGPYIERSLQYDVWLDAEGRPERAQLTLSFENTASADDIANPLKRIEGLRWSPTQGRFVPAPGILANYLRVFVSADSSLTPVSGSDDASGRFATGTEGGYFTMGTYLLLNPGDKRSVTFDYRPGMTQPAPDLYRLTVRKQSGVAHLPVRLIFHLTTASRLQSLPVDARRDGQLITIERDLTATATIDLQFERGRSK